MSVIHLVKYSCRDTIAVLRTLLSMAVRGELRGVAICYRTEHGAEESVFTGLYKANPANALAAANRMSWLMTQEHEARYGPP